MILIICVQTNVTLYFAHTQTDRFKSVEISVRKVNNSIVVPIVNISNTKDIKIKGKC